MNFNGKTGTIQIGSTSSTGTLYGPTWSSGTWVSKSNDLSSEIESLKELVQLLFQMNGIEVDVNDFINMSMSDRISYIRDLKLKKILD